ncbi:MAG: phosphoribosyltransferase [Burkholderiales bacterium]|nr:phosphoribosyltransferase [Burkholderiales bacterium]
MSDPTRFKNRTQAGELLALRLGAYASRTDAVVLALPRGGVPVAYALAGKLELPLDILLVRKLGMPGHEEFAMGAIASGGLCFLQQETLHMYGVSQQMVETVVQRELLELERREKLYRADRPALSVRGRVVILVDDGIATGSTMQAALLALRQAGPSRIVIATPVAADDAIASLEAEVDEVVCLSVPQRFYAVGLWYEVFNQVADEEVIRLLDAAARRCAADGKSPGSPAPG